MNNKPNFLGIGPPKTGSTSLFHYLREAEQVYLSPLKNPKFFYAKWDKSTAIAKSGQTYDQYISPKVKWAGAPIVDIKEYEKFFSGATQKHLAIGEISPGYFLFEDSPALIANYNPEMKLVLVLRNPVERLISHYNFFVQKRIESDSLFQALEKEEIDKPVYYNDDFLIADKRPRTYIRNGLYGRNLARFYRFFSPRQVFICYQEDLKSHPEVVLSDIFTFLELSKASPEKINYQLKHNVTRFSRSNFISRTIKLITPHQKYLYYLPKSIKRRLSQVRDTVNQFNSYSPPQFSLKSKRLLFEKYFSKDISNLENMLGKSFDHWKYNSI